MKSLKLVKWLNADLQRITGFTADTDRWLFNDTPLQVSSLERLENTTRSGRRVLFRYKSSDLQVMLLVRIRSPRPDVPRLEGVYHTGGPLTVQAQRRLRWFLLETSTAMNLSALMRESLEWEDIQFSPGTPLYLDLSAYRLLGLVTPLLLNDAAFFQWWTAAQETGC